MTDTTTERDDRVEAQDWIRSLQNELDRIRKASARDIENLTADLVAKNRVIDALQVRLSEFTDPPDEAELATDEEVAGLLELWHREVKDGRANIVVDPRSKRGLVVRAALKRRKKRRKGGGDHGGLDICRRAILGVTFDDWAMGRNPRTKGRQRNDIAAHILGRDDTLEEYADLYDRLHVPAPDVYRQMLERAERPAQLHPMRIALTGLRQLGCEWREEAPAQYLAQCPYHGSRPWSLHVFMAHGRCRMLCAQGCDEYTLLTGVGFIGPSDWQLNPHKQRRKGKS